MQVASRRRISGSEARLTFSLDEQFLELTEDSRQVDGIGGVAWDGSFLMALTLRRLVDSSPYASSLHVLELGCGTGVCGISIAHRVAAVTLTDQSVDLATSNCRSIRCASNVIAMPLSWGEDQERDLLRRRGANVPNLLVGCEIACLRSQLSKLMRTIDALAGRSTIVLLSFDELPPPNSCTAEREMNELMSAAGFSGASISAARVTWSRVEHGTSAAVMKEVAVESEVCLGSGEYPCPQSRAERASKGISLDSSEGVHHIVAYFRHSSFVSCKICGKPRLWWPAVDIQPFGSSASTW